MILTFLVYLLIAYVVYRLVFNFILPLYRTTRQIKKSFREMQERMRGQQGYEAGPSYGAHQGNGYSNGQAGSQPHPNGSNGTASKASKDEHGDYIEFEEIK